MEHILRKVNKWISLFLVLFVQFFNHKIKFKPRHHIMILKQSSKYPYETPGWSSIHSNQKYQNQGEIINQTNNKKEISILERLQSSKLKKLDQIHIASKMKIAKDALNKDSGSKYSMLQGNPLVQNKYRKNDPYKFKQSQNGETQSFSPLKSSTKTYQHHSNFKQNHQQLKLGFQRTPSRQKFLEPTQSWTSKITPQKVQTKSVSQNKPLCNKKLSQMNNSTIGLHQSHISKHEQLYLDSRKKQIKKSAEQIIENEYFNKKHPFRPQIGQISQFLAEQKFERMKERQKFQMEFENFQDWKQNQNSNKKRQKSVSMSQAQKVNDYFDVQNRIEKIQKEQQLKNYQILKNFFYFLSERQKTLSFMQLSSQRLCQLPSGVLKLLEPIIEQFYKNKNKSLTWIQFLSEFNLKIKNKKSFNGMVQKWFWVKFGVKFDQNKQQKGLRQCGLSPKECNSRLETSQITTKHNQQQSTQLNHSASHRKQGIYNRPSLTHTLHPASKTLHQSSSKR